jgi:hypothetical protein
MSILGICSISIGNSWSSAPWSLPGPSKMVSGGRSRTSQISVSSACADNDQPPAIMAVRHN